MIPTHADRLKRLSDLLMIKAGEITRSVADRERAASVKGDTGRAAVAARALWVATKLGEANALMSIVTALDTVTESDTPRVPGW